MDNMKATRQSYGEALALLGEKNEKIVVFDADLSSATKTCIFKDKYPTRFFNMGIAEQNMVGTAAGISTCGYTPFVSSFAAFLAGRAYEQIRSSVAYPKLNVKLCATHAGITVGEDGATHQMIEDISLMRTLPNMKVMCVSDDTQTKWAVSEIAKIDGPVYLRLCRLESPIIYKTTHKFEFGKAIQHGEGTDAAIIATGITVAEALKAQEILLNKNINVRVIDMHTIKPIDKEIIIKCAKETKNIYTVEDHSIIGGLGSAVIEVLSETLPVKVHRIGINDCFGKSGNAKKLMEYFRIDGLSIAETIENTNR